MTRQTSALGMARIAVALSALSLCVSLVGVTPADAVRAVKRALNADKVDGISASRKPSAGKLLPLGADKRFPTAVLPLTARGPRGPEGPQGATGPQGVPGPAGFSNIRQTNGAPTFLSQSDGVTSQVARLDNVPPGSWLISWTATLDYLQAERIGVYCAISVGQQQLADADISVGTGAGAAYTAVISSFGVTTQAQAFAAQLYCRPAGSSASPIHVDSQHIVAIRADALETTG